jgi:uncharacterized protein YbcI
MSPQWLRLFCPEYRIDSLALVGCDKRSSMKKTKGQVEAEISNALIQFEKDYKGRGPEETKSFIIEDMVLVRLKGVLTPAEQQLAKNPEGMNLIKKVRSNLLEQGREMLADAVEKITGLKVMTLHTDISTKTGERMIIFSLNKNLEEQFAKSPKKTETLKK